MSIIDTIVSALRSLTGGGAGGSTTRSGSDGSRSEGQVSVEHEPDASTEAAVKGGDADADVSDDAGSDADEGDADEADAAAAGTDAAASTETLVDEEAGREPAEAAASGTTGEADEPDAPDEADGSEPTAEGSAESVETIKGIGPAYAGRLEGIGIETVGELAAADAGEVADGIDVSESRVSDWIERASDAS